MNPQKKTKITVFDVLFIIFIVAAVAYAGYTMFFKPIVSKQTARNLEFTVQIPTATRDMSELVKVGDIITVSGKGVATVKKIEVDPARKLVLDSVSGEYKNSIVPERFDILVTAVGDAVETDQQITLGKMPIRVGATVSLEGRGYSLNGSVLNMYLSNTEDEVTNNAG